MSLAYISTQIAPIIANAGLTQNVTISSPSTLTLGGAGIATASGGTGTTSSTAIVNSWPQWALAAALLWLAYKWLRA